MKTIRFAAAIAALAVAASAQTCLSTLFTSNNGGSVGGAVYFDITANVGIAIQSLETNYAATAGTPVGVDVYMTAAGGTSVGNQANAAAWTLMGSDNGAATSAGLDVPTAITLAAPIVVAPGTYGVALVARGSGHRYTNGNGANQAFSDANLSLALGTASNAPFTAPIFTPRVFNGTICYALGAGFAQAIRFGRGCGGQNPPSFHETFAGANFDLSNTAHQYLYNGINNYAVVPSAGSIVAPTSAGLGLTDDSVAQVTLPFAMQRPGGAITDVWVDSNGRVGFAAITTDLSETVAELLSGAPKIALIWDDLNPAAGGNVHAEVDPTDPNTFHITYINVPEFGTAAGSNTVQLSLSASGNMKVTYGSCTVGDCIVGYSPGGGSTGQAIDISSALPWVLGDGTPALSLVNVARPVIGQTAISETRNIPAAAVAGVHVIGFSAVTPPVDFAIIGAPGCFWYAAADVTLGFGIAGSTASHSLPIPNTASLAGGSLFIQSVVVVPGLNAGNLGSTNGIEYVLNVQ